jgi:hypothetical protein
MNWHLEVIAAKRSAVHEGKIRRLIINLPPRHLKSLMASIAFPAWCLGLDPLAQILCVGYAQDLAEKLVRDCRGNHDEPVKPPCTALARKTLEITDFVFSAEGPRAPK